MSLMMSHSNFDIKMGTWAILIISENVGETRMTIGVSDCFFLTVIKLYFTIIMALVVILAHRPFTVITFDTSHDTMNIQSSDLHIILNSFLIDDSVSGKYNIS